ncbi:MAG: colanic acid biosynthesis glycosyltransferase WcaL, partial [Acidobacteria bacterium]
MDEQFSLPCRVGYVVKRYPRFSETFIVSEILAHEEAGLGMEIFSLYPPNDSHFQSSIARVRAPVTYIPAEGLRATDFWSGVQQAVSCLPDVSSVLDTTSGAQARDVYQGLLLACEARRKHIQHLHAHFATVATSVVRLAARFANVSYSFTAHAKDIFHSSVNHEELRRNLNEAAAVVTVSDYNLEHLRRRFGPMASRVRRIYNGLDFDQLGAPSPQSGRSLIVAVGRLIEKKGFSHLVKACRVLADRGRSFECLIIGTGSLQPALQAQIDAEHLTDCVKLIGPRPRDEVLCYMRRAAVCAVPCVVSNDGDRDGLPTVLLEAMAVGAPCVATDVTGIPEAIQDGETGFVVPQHDPVALAAATERLLDDPELRARIAGHARRLVESHFDVRRNAADLRELFLSARSARQETV